MIEYEVLNYVKQLMLLGFKWKRVKGLKLEKYTNSHKYMLECDFDIAIEGKNDQHVIKHKKIGWSLISEPWGKSANMQKFRGQNKHF